MKKLLLPFLGLFLLISCQEETDVNDYVSSPSSDQKTLQEEGVRADAPKPKILVCHRANGTQWVLIEINENAWPAHEAHGDVRLDDQDGDGYVPFNGCDTGDMGDCDDNDPTITLGPDEICNNGIDDDCDGLVDEEDYVDCCPPAGTICTTVDGELGQEDGFCNCDPCPAPGTPCTTTANTPGQYSENCDCVPCPPAGTLCTTPDGNLGQEDGNCNCVPCPPPGTTCTDANGQVGQYDADCNCVPCPPEGSTCIDANGNPGRYDANCNCVPCPPAGTPCTDATGQTGVEDGDCNCVI